jgi:putative nucleotidyltransferase with HDIG domain
MKDIKKNEKSLDQYDQIPKLVYQVMDAVLKVFQLKDPYTAAHQKKVALLSSAIAKEMNLSEGQIESIYIAAMIHDIGKISVPSEILSKPDSINEAEYTLIKNHPEIAFETLKDIESPWQTTEIIIQHHERLDGSGYPFGLTNEDIILEAKILGVADIIEAMSSHRPYRPSLGIDHALEEIVQNKGKLYDPKVVDACVSVFNEKKFDF